MSSKTLTNSHPNNHSAQLERRRQTGSILVLWWMLDGSRIQASENIATSFDSGKISAKISKCAWTGLKN